MQPRCPDPSRPPLPQQSFRRLCPRVSPGTQGRLMGARSASQAPPFHPFQRWGQGLRLFPVTRDSTGQSGPSKYPRERLGSSISQFLQDSRTECAQDGAVRDAGACAPCPARYGASCRDTARHIAPRLRAGRAPGRVQIHACPGACRGACRGGVPSVPGCRGASRGASRGACPGPCVSRGVSWGVSPVPACRGACPGACPGPCVSRGVSRRRRRCRERSDGGGGAGAAADGGGRHGHRCSHQRRGCARCARRDGGLGPGPRLPRVSVPATARGRSPRPALLPGRADGDPLPRASPSPSPSGRRRAGAPRGEPHEGSRTEGMCPSLSPSPSPPG